MKKRKKKLINSITVFLLILAISCQSAPIAIVQDEAKALERETMPPDEATLQELHEASELARSYRQKLISSGIPNFSFNDWQIASTLYDRTVKEERTSTIREAQESIARYQLTSAILETLYLSATNENPVGGSSEYDYEYNEYDTAWYFDDPITASAVPPPNSLILSQIPASSTRPAGSSGDPDRQESITEKDKEPGKGLYIPDIPTRDDLRVAAMVVSGIDPEDIVIPESPSSSASSFTPPPTTVQTLTEEEQTAAVKVDPAKMPTDEAIEIAKQELEKPDFTPPAKTTVVTLPKPVTETAADVTETPAVITPVEITSAAITPAAIVTEAPEVTVPVPPSVTDTPSSFSASSFSTSSSFSRYPAQYKVISWDLYKDCLWMIAYRVYNDPKKWRIIYEANKHKMRSPDNPDLIFPGEVLDIPSLDGEERTGMWDGSMGYTWKKED